MAIDWGVDPLIYLAPDAALFRAGAEAFGGLPFVVVWRLAEGADAGGCAAAPLNFRLAPALPWRQLLERTTLAIHTADPELVDECLRAGVPQLIYARDEESARVANRVERLGVGLRLSAGDLEGPRLRDLAGKVMADPSYTRAATSFSERAAAAIRES